MCITFTYLFLLFAGQVKPALELSNPTLNKTKALLVLPVAMGKGGLELSKKIQNQNPSSNSKDHCLSNYNMVLCYQT